jgi:formate dehydrogenase maturation protein FdhE
MTTTPNEKPEAPQMANFLANLLRIQRAALNHLPVVRNAHTDAADELDRLHAENADLRAELAESEKGAERFREVARRYDALKTSSANIVLEQLGLDVSFVLESFATAIDAARKP